MIDNGRGQAIGYCPHGTAVGNVCGQASSMWAIFLYKICTIIIELYSDDYAHLVDICSFFKYGYAILPCTIFLNKPLTHKPSVSSSVASF